jgi:hypothetical protein
VRNRTKIDPQKNAGLDQKRDSVSFVGRFN